MDLLIVIGKLFLASLPNIYLKLLVVCFLGACSAWVYRDAKANQSGFAWFWSSSTFTSWIPFFFLYLLKRHFDRTQGRQSTGSRFILVIAGLFVLVPIVLLSAAVYFGAKIFSAIAQGEASEREVAAQIESISFEFFQENNQSGIRIKNVKPSGFAAQLNLGKGDIVKALDGEEIDSFEKAYAISPEYRLAAQQPQLKIERSGQAYGVTLPPGTWQPPDLQSAPMRQIIRYSDQGQPTMCEEYIGLSDAQIKNTLETCQLLGRSCSFTSALRCPEADVVVDCVRYRVERGSIPYRTVYYHKQPSFGWPPSFFKFQCKGAVHPADSNQARSVGLTSSTANSLDAEASLNKKRAERMAEAMIVPVMDQRNNVRGLQIAQLSKGSFVESLGLLKDDVVLKIDGVAIDSLQKQMLLSDPKYPTPKQLEIERAGKVVDLAVPVK